ncbi:hypothetical protein CYMTET_28580 [Cymbomonas tetramitiformis]|uniref:Core-binding (CB) domain-containing protein n=1 Tax=Cymbomonas tetramitiformis TaxID=36881 RepID=A0AAE0FMV5_9CHLO|nr:hypothetical protein CYMTET_28580 [Cymbomonas tetramitiformis]
MEKEASTTFELVSYTAHWEMYKRDKAIKEKGYGGGGGGSGSSWNAVGTGSRYSKKPRVSDPEQPDASVVKPDKPEGEIVVEPEKEREDGATMASGDREPEPAEELLEELAVAVERYQDGAYAESTQRSYDTGVKAFLTFCGVRRQWDRPAKPVMPITLRDLARMAEFADMESITGLALWAAILVGFYGLFRKDNLTTGKSQAWNARGCNAREACEGEACEGGVSRAQVCEAALRIAPKHSKSRFRAALAYASTAQTAQAKAELRRLLRDDPSNAEAQRLLHKMQQQTSLKSVELIVRKLRKVGLRWPVSFGIADVPKYNLKTLFISQALTFRSFRNLRASHPTFTGSHDVNVSGERK